ncbi:hypothetical protein HBI56_144930 [Parastagonospora nodorum]|nr:hypothetical protein HBH51_053740 [Parastagonospora nodorum]KAH4125833.1 hypothetical protein HBH47_052470 [Parastagonospora nodorum]KAH4200978.1 hypothetical protein HBH42_023100 [Parastagonospora nodorum]KAH4208946.1 hypothetical protein HBI95_083370 [Parastagonospora nodorum]KAH4262609.1 hypothetical protein HBI03_112010 [Parastagonospora nodorum]
MVFCSGAIIHYCHPAAWYGATTKGRFLLCGWSLVSAVGIYHWGAISKRWCQSVFGCMRRPVYQYLYDAGMILRSQSAQGSVGFFSIV